MSDVNARAARYLTPPDGAFWRWSDDGDVVEWSDGPTIAFRSEVAAVLARLSPHGLPAMDLVVLLLAACRDTWGEDPRGLDILTRVHTLKARISAVQWIRDTIEALDAVHCLPGDLRKPVDAKAELAAFVFETHPLRTSSQEAEEVCKLLNAGFSPEWPQFPERPIKTVGEWIRELRGLFDGLQRVNEDEVRTRFETGLDQVPQPVPDEPDETVPEFDGGIRELLDVLEREDEFRGLVRLTRNLMAVTHLPRPVHDSDDLSLGGVSDISNRGPLDRLLLSELAHDDDTLMVRVALNEALFLRRERPPAMPPRELAVLLDSGLRMWGLPRVYATAVALSLAATADDATDVRVYRAAGEAVEAVDLTTREGLVEHLAALDPRVHPGDSLPAFARELGDVDCDVVLVTGEDVLADREFRFQLAECELPPTYISALGREGEYRMIARSVRGERTLREAVFSLEQLFGESKRSAPLINESVDPKLPAILRLKRFPLRLSHHVDPRNMMAIPDPDRDGPRVLAVTRDRRLMLWDARNQGARQLAERLPERHVLWWDAEDDGTLVRCVIGRQGFTSLHVLTVNLATTRWTVEPLVTERRGGHTVCGHAGVLFVVRHREIEVFDPADGRKLASQRLQSHVHWARDRFFRSPPHWLALSFDGVDLRMEPVVSHERLSSVQIRGVFDSEVVDGPLIVLYDGNLFNPSTGDVQRVDHGLAIPVSLAAVSKNGSAYAIRPVPTSRGGTSHECVVSLKSKPTVTRVRNAVAYLESAPLAAVQTRSLRVRVKSVVANRGGLWLVRRDDRRLGLWLDATADCLHWTPDFDREGGPLSPTTETVLQSKKDGGYELRSFEWGDGSRAVLDSRGLLHLQSSIRAVPDVTLVLYDANVAGWCADGRMWGPEYFVGSDQEPCSAAAIYNDVLTPFLRRLR